MPNNKKIAYSIIILFIIIIVISTMYGKKSRKILMQHYSFTDGKIIKFNKSAFGNPDQIVYIYKINNKILEDTRSYFIKNHTGNKFIDKIFPVIYDTKNATVHYILISPKDFEQFTLTFPDSLNWVKDNLD